ncbi:MAG: hypothetical protein IKK00_07290 [Oscillospiraceae bacterium]|nr:hypothetical protein [Oscillospiraceae bacterium]
MGVLQEYKCPCCDGAIEFDSNLQKMKCPYCDTEFEVETLAAYDDALRSDVDDEMDWESTPAEVLSDGLRAYVCNSCGGEVIGDEQTAATACPYCGNPVVMMEQFAGSLKPDLVIPFKLDKKAAIAALKKHYEGKRLLPRVFKDENHLEEIQGVYVPVWLFDTGAEADVRYKATQVRAWSDSRYNYTQTSYFALSRSGSLQFTRIPVDGSSKMDDTMMESLEPYDPADAVDFQTAYLAGYLADKYDVDADKCIPRANERVKRSTEEAFAATTSGYTSVIPEHSSVRLKHGKTRYALYPVWLLNTKWNGNTYTFAMNGQTGKLAGDLPMDKGIYKKWLFGLTAVVGAVAFGLSYLLWLL